MQILQGICAAVEVPLTGFPSWFRELYQTYITGVCLVWLSGLWGSLASGAPICGAICLDTIFRHVCILNLKLPS